MRIARRVSPSSSQHFPPPQLLDVRSARRRRTESGAESLCQRDADVLEAVRTREAKAFRRDRERRVEREREEERRVREFIRMNIMDEDYGEERQGGREAGRQGGREG